MRLRRLALDLQASFGITSSVGDGELEAVTLQNCVCVLNVDHFGCTRRNHIASSDEGMRFRHRCALERTARHSGCIPTQRIGIESLTTDARSCLSLQGVIGTLEMIPTLRPIRVKFQ